MRPFASPGVGAGSPVRILAFIDTLQLSGPARQLVHLSEALAPLGVSLEIVTFRRRGRDEAPFVTWLRSSGTEVAVLPESGPWDSRLPGRVLDLIRQRQPDLVQSHSYKATTAIASLRLWGQLPCPWIGYYHGATAENLKVRTYHALDRTLLRLADRVIVMSNRQAQAFRGLGNRVAVIHNAVLPRPAAGQAKAPPIAAPLPRLAVIGRLSREKGVDILLEAVATIPGPLAILVAGDGPERRSLEIRAAGLPEGIEVTFLGHVQDPSTVYRDVDLVVIPSRSEGLPNVLLEALAADCPVVATDVGAIPEVIGGSAGAIMVPHESAAALAEGIVRGLSCLRSDEASRERERIASSYSLDHRVKRHVALYTEVLTTTRVRE